MVEDDREPAAHEPFSVTVGRGPLVAVAVHHGHDLRPEVAAAIRIDDATRLREEDPHTGEWTTLAPTRLVVHRSRFEVDLNRPRSGGVYTTPAAAWGIDVWGDRVDAGLRRRSLRIHGLFYRRLARILQAKSTREGAFVLYDLHSYNHRRDGPHGPPADPGENPEVNVGTGHLDRRRWAPVVEAFIETASRREGGGTPLDVRENVRFRGGYLSRWVSERFPTTGCTLAIDVKKTFMDEWTGRLDVGAFQAMGARLAATTGPVRDALGRILAGTAGRAAL